MMSNKSDVNGTGVVTYGQCSDDAGIFHLDKDNTSNTPNPVTKGSEVSLNLAGIVDDEMEITNVHIHVDWNGSTLYDEDHKQDNDYTSSYKYSLSWAVPSYAPSGKYAITVTGTGASSAGTGKEMCITAGMQL